MKVEEIDDKEDSFLFSDKEENDENENDILITVKNSNNDEDKNTLIDMGFDKNLVEKIYSNMSPSNMQEAIDFLSKNEKGLFTHSYIPDNSNNNSTCLICNEKKSKHAVQNNKGNKNYEKGEKNNTKNHFYEIQYCEICDETISEADYEIIKIECKHIFCIDCWFNYLKEKINNANVDKITCMRHGCNTIISENFINKIISEDENLLKKYNKFLQRQKLLSTMKNIKFCPYPDCDGYALKPKKTNEVKCNYGHEFCFNCLLKPHGKTKCSLVEDDGFKKWKESRIIKRCPHCKYWTEKNEGCNHMTCVQCKFQWCWLCQKECLIGHYSSGSCKGLHFEKEINEENTKKLLEKNKLEYPESTGIKKFLIRLLFFALYIFFTPYFYMVSNGIKYMDGVNSILPAIFYGLSILQFFIFIEITFTSFIIIISLPAIFIWPYFRFLRFLFFTRSFGKVFTA